MQRSVSLMRGAAFLAISAAILSWRKLAAFPYQHWWILAWEDFRTYLSNIARGPVNWIDVIVGTTILAIVPFILAAYGGHVAAETLPDPRLRRSTKLKFWVLCAIGVLLAFYQQYRASQSDTEREKRTDLAQRLILDQLGTLHGQAPPSAPKAGPTRITEAARRKSILASLRSEYMLSHKVVSPGILAGTEQPPAEWVNSRLKALGEKWTVGPEHPLTVSNIEILPYNVGKKLTARVHLNNPEAPTRIHASFYRGFGPNLDDQYDARKAVEDAGWRRVEAQAATDQNTILDVPVIADTFLTVDSEEPLSQDQADRLKTDLTWYVMVIIDVEGGARIEKCIHTGRNGNMDVQLCISHN